VTRSRQSLGRFGEELALEALIKLGYQCLARNFRCALGEIDIIARDRETLVFIEIKTRRGRSTGYAKEAITPHKKKQLSKVALAYLKENDAFEAKSRFDVVAISMAGGKPEVEVIRNAFELAYP
jgi:putative endonuclease